MTGGCVEWLSNTETSSFERTTQTSSDIGQTKTLEIPSYLEKKQRCGLCWLQIDDRWLLQHLFDFKDCLQNCANFKFNRKHSWLSSPLAKKTRAKARPLFVECTIRSDYMPLGFQFFPSPDREKRCDLTDCPVSGNVPWKILKHAGIPIIWNV